MLNEIEELENHSAAIIQPLYEVKSWIKFLAIFNIVIGAIYSTMLVGIVLVWIGVVLLNVCKSLEKGYQTDNEAEMRNALNELAKSIKILSILLIVWVSFMILIMIAYFGMILIFVILGIAQSS